MTSSASLHSCAAPAKPLRGPLRVVEAIDPEDERARKKLDIRWCWIKCTRYPHMRAVAIARYVIRWGPHGWRDMLRQAARCTKCGKRGVELQHPSWDGSDTGWAAMPISQMAPVPPLD